MATCNICFDDCSLDNTIKTPCGHTFCNSCLTQWLLKKTTCPSCRHPIGEKDNFEENEYDDEDIEIGYNFDIYHIYTEEIPEHLFQKIENEVFDLADFITGNQEEEYINIRWKPYSDESYYREFRSRQNTYGVKVYTTEIPESNVLNIDAIVQIIRKKVGNTKRKKCFRNKPKQISKTHQKFRKTRAIKQPKRQNY